MKWVFRFRLLGTVLPIHWVTFFFLQEVAEYYSKHAQSSQRWHTPQIIEDLKVCKDIVASLFTLFPNIINI